MTEADLADLQTAVSNAWSRDTARQWSKESPAEGQCNVTAIVVQELAGGEILKTPMNGSFHFYNLFGG